MHEAELATQDHATQLKAAKQELHAKESKMAELEGNMLYQSDATRKDLPSALAEIDTLKKLLDATKAAITARGTANEA